MSSKRNNCNPKKKEEGGQLGAGRGQHGATKPPCQKRLGRTLHKSQVRYSRGMKHPNVNGCQDELLIVDIKTRHNVAMGLELQGSVGPALHQILLLAQAAQLSTATFPRTRLHLCKCVFYS